MKPAGGKEQTSIGPIILDYFKGVYMATPYVVLICFICFIIGQIFGYNLKENKNESYRENS